MGGTIRTRRISGRFSFAAMVNGLRIESVGDTPRAFFYTRNERQEAFLYREAYSVLAKGDDLIELMLGLPLTPSDLQRVLTACPRIGGSLEFHRFDDQWVKVRVTESPSNKTHDLYIRRNPDGLGWTQEVLVGQVVGRTTRWRAEFHREDSGQPSWVRLVSSEWNGTLGEAFDVRLSFRRVQVNAILGPETFTIAPSPCVAVTRDLDSIRSTQSKSAPFLIDPRAK
jgi:hypothetical protein